jgi:hypothetical protein
LGRIAGKVLEKAMAGSERLPRVLAMMVRMKMPEEVL